MKFVAAFFIASLSVISSAKAGPCHDVIDQVNTFYEDALDDKEIALLNACAGVNKVCMLSDGDVVAANHAFAISNPDAIVTAGIMQQASKSHPSCVMAVYTPGRGATWTFKGIDLAPFGGDIKALESYRLNSDVVSASELVSKFRDISRRFLKN